MGEPVTPADRLDIEQLDQEVYERGLQIGGIEALREQRNRLASELRSRVAREEQRDALLWEADKVSAEDGDFEGAFAEVKRYVFAARALAAAAVPAPPKGGKSQRVTGEGHLRQAVPFLPVLPESEQDALSAIEEGSMRELLDQVERWLAWSGGRYPDDSPGDVIHAEADGTITLDDGITTWNPLRALAFLAASSVGEPAKKDEGADPKEGETP